MNQFFDSFWCEFFDGKASGEFVTTTTKVCSDALHVMNATTHFTLHTAYISF